MTVAYGTNEKAQSYFDLRLNTGPWDVSTAAERLAGRTEAARMIDLLNYLGKKTDPDQENQFPRYPDTEVPVAIEEASYEITLALLDGYDPELEFENLSLSASRYADSQSTIDTSSLPEHTVAGIPSIRAWRLLKSFLRDGRNIQMMRTS